MTTGISGPVAPIRSPTNSRKQGPVRQPGQRVVVGLVAELLLEARQLGQRLLEVAVLEGDGRLVGEGPQQPEVVVAERGPLGQPVGDDHRADDVRLAAQRADHLPSQAAVRIAGLVHERAGRRSNEIVERVLEGVAGGAGDLRVPVVPRPRPQALGVR